MEEEEEEPKIYINNRTNSWAVVGNVNGVVTVLTKEQPYVESKVIPDWVKEAMREEEKEEVGEAEVVQQKVSATPPLKQPIHSTPASLRRNNAMVENLTKLFGIGV